VTEPGTISAAKTLAKRFAAPVIAAWLLHLGVWMLIVSVAEPSLMSVLTRTVNWFGELLAGGSWRIEEASWPSRFVAFEIGESIVPIFIGLLIGWWVLWRKAKRPELSA
jgi:hypothetical protein